jgi:hypothetical protein
MLRSGPSTFLWCWCPMCQPAMIVRTLKPVPVMGVRIRSTASFQYKPIQTSVLHYLRILKPRQRRTGNITAAAEAISRRTRQGYKKGTTSQRYNAGAYPAFDGFLFYDEIKTRFTKNRGTPYPYQHLHAQRDVDSGE